MSVTLVFYPGVAHSVVAPIEDGINPVSTVMVSDFNVTDRITAVKSSDWNIKGQGISSQKQASFDTLKRVHATGWLESSSLVRPVTWPVDVRSFVPSAAFDVYVRKSVTRVFKFNVLKRKAARHTIFFDVYNYMFAHASIRFNTLRRIFKPGVTQGTWINQLNEPVTKPVSDGNFTVTPLAEWNSQKLVTCQRAIRFNDRDRLSVQKSIRFNDNGIVVVCQKSISWETLERI